MFHLKAWQCPPILFMGMGFFIILSMLATYLLAGRYSQEPQIAALAVIFITIVSLAIGTFIVSGFNRIVDAHRLKSQFISLASHQLRSPLSVLKWTLDAAHHDYQTYSPADFDSLITTLYGATEAMVQLVDSLLNINRIEAGTLVLNKESLAPGELAQKAIQRFQTSAKTNQSAIDLVVADALPNVSGDINRVIEILCILIDNAIRYTPKQGRVTVRLEKKEKDVLFAVEDSGIGIPPKDQRRIFEKFFRAQNASLLQSEGTGIGLYIARAVVEGLGGTIGFTSTEGNGSRFFFTLPIHQEDSV